MGKQDGAQDRWVGNAAANIAGVTVKTLREQAYGTYRSSIHFFPEVTDFLTFAIPTEMFSKVDKGLRERLRMTTETKIENNCEHPHKTAWH